jgi:hypothetical protein
VILRFGKLAQTVFPGGAETSSIQNQAFQSGP